MILLHPGDALGRGDQVDQTDVMASALLEERDGGGGAAAGSQHGIQHQKLAVLAVVRQFAVVFHRVEGFRIAVQADVAHLGRRDQVQHAVHHAQTGPQDRNDTDLLAAQNAGLRGADGRFHFGFLGGEIAGHFVDHQHADFLQQLAELLCAGFFVPHQAQLVLDQGMVEYVYLTHEIVPPSS